MFKLIKSYKNYKKFSKLGLVKKSFFWWFDTEYLKIKFSKKYRDKVFYSDFPEAFYDFNNEEHAKEYEESMKK